MQNLFKRDGVWWGRVQIAGRDLRRSLRTRNRSEANKRLSAWLEQVNHIAFYGEERPSYKAAVIRWLEEYLPQSVKPSTAKRYIVSIKQLDPYFRDKYLDQIKRRTVADYVAARSREATNATIRRDLTALSRMFSCCVAWGWMENNPALDFDRTVIKERRSVITPPTDEAVEEMIRRCPPQFARVVKLLAETGMRQNEALTLEWRDVDMERGLITLRNTKTSRPRTIELVSPGGNGVGTITGTVRTLHCPYVFPAPDGFPLKNFSSRFGMYNGGRKTNADLSFRCHDLRHRFAINWLKNGGGIYELSRHLGHSSVKTTEIYLGYVGTNPGTAMTVSQRLQNGNGSKEGA